MSTRTALIVIGTFKQEWFGLAPVAQAEFVSRVGSIANAAGLEPQIGYRLTETPGAFVEVWEGPDHASVDQAKRELIAMGYTTYVKVAWMIGEREVAAPPLPRAKPVPTRARKK